MSLWYFYDGNGNVTQLMRSGGSLPVSAHYEYDAYGNVISTTGTYASTNRFRFSTKWLDTDLPGGELLYYYGYRYYIPRLGRWGNWDPIGEEGGLSLYGFVCNRAINSLDLLGLAAPPRGT